VTTALWSTYDVGGARFMIYPSAGVASGRHDQLGFLVGDLAWPVSQLRQHGITFDDHAGPDGIADFGRFRPPGSRPAKATYAARR
jgi:hypothetical protein